VRIGVLSDIHGNLRALEAVLRDIDRVSPDLVLLGGDLAVNGPRPAEVIDTLRARGCTGVLGNTDELLFDPSGQAEQERRAPRLVAWLRLLFNTLGPWAREQIGDERANWLRTLPRHLSRDDLYLVHASPADLWRAPMPDATASELEATYGTVGCPLVIYAHIHRPYVRNLDGITIANTGSVGLPYDGDARASYLLVEDGQPTIKRVEYDIALACRDLASSDFPLQSWLAKVLRSGRFSHP
jgi:putative phosphoesterase